MRASAQLDDDAVPGVAVAARAALVAVVVLGVGHFVVATELGWWWAGWSYPVGNATSVAAAWFGFSRWRPQVGRTTWRWILVGLTCYVAGDLVWQLMDAYGSGGPDVGPPDVGWVASYACLLVGGLRLGQARLGARNADSLVDAVSLTATLVLLLWSPVVEPAFVGAPLTHQLVLGAYPVADIVLVAITVRFVFFRGSRSMAALTMFGAALTMLVADGLYALAVRNGWYEGGAVWLDALFMVGIGCWSIAFVFPGIRRAASRAEVVAGEMTNGRLALSGMALIAAPLATAGAHAVGSEPNVLLLIVTASIATTAILYRIRRLVSDGVEARRDSDRQRAFFRDIAEHANDVVLVLDRYGTVASASGSVGNLYGRAPEDLVGLAASHLIHPDDREHAGALYAQVLGTPNAVLVIESRTLHLDGTSRWVLVRMVNRLEGSVVGGIVLNVSDITDRKEAEQQLSHQALHDALTGLANRTLLEDRLEHALARRRGQVGLLYLDLDRFKVVNDSLGHEAGDRLLVAVADRLRAVVGPADTVARLGGDEFAIVVELDDVGEGPCEQRLVAVAERVLADVRVPVDLDGIEVVVGTSVGAVVAGEGERAAEILRHGDLALYAAKSSGKDCVRVFDAAMQLAASNRLSLETDLRRAIDDGQLVLHYQPIVALAAMELAGFEALVRWQHPTRGLLGPDKFIPIAEECGLVVPLGEWVLDEACRVAAEWQLDRTPEQAVSIAVNVSAVQLADAGLVDAVAGALATHHLDPSVLTIELTETALIRDPVVAKSRLALLKAIGVRIAIDDFGTGYSSLGYLREFPIDALKIDRSFLDPRTAEFELPAIVQGVLGLGTTLGLVTVAEGVENDSQLDRLLASGCDYGQGYLFSRPLPEEAATRLARCRGPVDGRRRGRATEHEAGRPGA
jgi:diguanylate cyclase (GGDEF)-like protein/PAS domain S-box-containing protein